MMDRLETVTVTVDGRVLTGWTEIEITCGAERAVRTASLRMPLPAAAGLEFGMEAVVSASGEPVVTGYTRDIDREHDGDGGEARLSIVSKTADAVEGSIDHPEGYVEKKALDAIAKEFGSQFVIIRKADLKEVPYHQIVPGESVHATLERIARRQGVMIYDDGTGAIVLADKPEGRHSGALAWGINLTRASFSRTEQGRHDETIVRGQSSRGQGPSALRLEGRAPDEAIKRIRKRILALEDDADRDSVKTRAEWSARRAAGKSIRGSATLPGWRDQGGKLWSPNWVVAFADPDLEADQDMAIAQVRLRQSERGTEAELELVDPRAFGGEDPKGSTPLPVPSPKAKVTAAP